MCACSSGAAWTALVITLVGLIRHLAGLASDSGASLLDSCFVSSYVLKVPTCICTEAAHVKAVGGSGGAVGFCGVALCTLCWVCLMTIFGYVLICLLLACCSQVSLEEGWC